MKRSINAPLYEDNASKSNFVKYFLHNITNMHNFIVFFQCDLYLACHKLNLLVFQKFIQFFPSIQHSIHAPVQSKIRKPNRIFVSPFHRFTRARFLPFSKKEKIPPFQINFAKIQIEFGIILWSINLECIGTGENIGILSEKKSCFALWKLIGGK